MSVLWYLTLFLCSLLHAAAHYTPVHSLIDGVIVTHCHADHDAGAFQKILFEGQVTVITTPTIYGSFIRKYSALSGLPPALLRQTHRFLPATIGETLRVRGASLNFFYTLHSIPCVGLEVCVCVHRGSCWYCRLLQCLHGVFSTCSLAEWNVARAVAVGSASCDATQ
jgi:hypothetical protein